MNRRAFLQALALVIPAPMLARFLPTVADAPIAEAIRIEPATQVDFVPISDSGVTYTSTGLFVRILVIGETVLSAKSRLMFDLLVDGVRQRQELDVRVDDSLIHQFALVFETMPAAGSHTYGVAHRESNGTATTNARIHVSEVW